VLGSGLSHVADRLQQTSNISYVSIPHFPQSTVPGHAGELRAGIWEQVPVAVLSGRMHLYEGYSSAEVVFPVRVLGLWGIKALVLTCAAGGISGAPGSLMIFSDHINLQGQNPLAGPHDEHWGVRFLDVSQAYDPAFRQILGTAAREFGVPHFEGVYAAVLGPSYETPAEIRAFRALGADAVGMSTVLEVLAARQLGMRVAAIAAITNLAAGMGTKPLSHQEVLAHGKSSSGNLMSLLAGFLRALKQQAE
jgi:purine-nucleoside phosphorylase